MRHKKDSLIEIILNSEKGHERLLTRFFAILLDSDRMFLKDVCEILFKNCSQATSGFNEIAKDCEVWFDLQLVREKPWPQPDILIVNPGFWKNSVKEYCYLIEIKRGARITNNQIERYLDALGQLKTGNNKFHGALAVLTDFPPSQNIQPLHRDLIHFFKDKDLISTAENRLKDCKKKHDRGQPNSPAAYMLSEFLFWCKSERKSVHI